MKEITWKKSKLKYGKSGHFFQIFVTVNYFTEIFWNIIYDFLSSPYNWNATYHDYFYHENQEH